MQKAQSKYVIVANYKTEKIPVVEKSSRANQITSKFRDIGNNFSIKQNGGYWTLGLPISWELNSMMLNSGKLKSTVKED